MKYNHAVSLLLPIIVVGKNRDGHHFWGFCLDGQWLQPMNFVVVCIPGVHRPMSHTIAPHWKFSSFHLRQT